LLHAHKFANEYPAVERGLLFMGRPASARPTSLVVDNKRSDRKGFAGLFYEFGSLLKEIQDSYNPISKSSS
jgi:hypothetical protein